MNYILQTNLAFALLYIIYRLFLRDLTFFNLNRWVLILMPLSALLIPLFHWKQGGEVIGGIILPLAETGTFKPEVYQSGVIQSWFEMTYAIIGMIFLSVFLFRLSKLIQYLSQLNFQKEDGLNVAYVKSSQSSFSFFHFIVISQKEGIEKERILRHEMMHAGLLHSLDRIWAELAHCFFCLNPFLPAYKSDVKNNAEFQVDSLLKEEEDLEYLNDLGHSQVLLQEIALTNSFISKTNLLNRIVMMTKKPSSSFKRISYIYFIPAFMISVMIFSCNQESVEQIRPDDTEIISGEAIKELSPLPSYVGGMDAMIQFMIDNIEYPQSAKDEGIDGTVFVQFIVEKDGSVSKAEVLRSVDDRLDNEALRVVGMMPKWIPGKKDGQEVRVAFTLPVKFSIE